MAALVRQIKESEGKVILASSRDDEVSIEKPDFPNSIFTHYLLRGLRGEASDKNGIVTLEDLYDYVHEKTVRETSGIQHPRLIGNLEGSFPLALASLHRTSLPAASRTRPSVLPISESFSDYRDRAERFL